MTIYYYRYLWMYNSLEFVRFEIIYIFYCNCIYRIRHWKKIRLLQSSTCSCKHDRITAKLMRVFEIKIISRWTNAHDEEWEKYRRKKWNWERNRENRGKKELKKEVERKIINIWIYKTKKCLSCSFVIFIATELTDLWLRSFIFRRVNL